APSADRPALRRLAAQADAAAFNSAAPAEHQAVGYWRELEAWQRAHWAGLSRARRLRQALSLRSLSRAGPSGRAARACLRLKPLAR
ncbi:MAG: hypothetical protein LBD90_04450, partial [Bifidobacteriaceae bacterium]|nr:hypothetical protein [Bifidobacteriaceae bacterium]